MRSLLGLAPNDQNIPGLETNGQGGDGLVNGDSPVKPSRQADQVKRWVSMLSCGKGKI